MKPALHLSWCQSATGKQFFSVHRNPACANSCATFIWGWRPLPVMRITGFLEPEAATPSAFAPRRMP